MNRISNLYIDPAGRLYRRLEVQPGRNADEFTWEQWIEIWVGPTGLPPLKASSELGNVYLTNLGGTTEFSFRPLEDQSFFYFLPGRMLEN